MKKLLQITAALALTTLLASGISTLFAAEPIAPVSPSSETAAASGDQPSLFAQIPDVFEPSDVENLTAVPGDSEVQLMWDAATDNAAVTGYRIYRGSHSVQATEDRYDLPTVTVGPVTSYTVKELINGQPYFFSMTAFDAAGNESPNYALEANATPQSGLRLASAEDDGKSPQVKEVKAEDVVTVQVVFSEAVKLPEDHPASAFIIATADRTRLQVQNAVLDDRDESGATVLLTTAPQQEGVEYILTAGIEVQDLYGNGIISGTSDTGSFKGSAKTHAGAAPAPVSPAPATPSTESSAADTVAPTVEKGSADYNNRITLEFSEAVKLPANPNEQITITKQGTSETLKVLNVSLSVDGKTAYITTDPQNAVPYEVRVNGFSDAAGNTVAEDTRTIMVQGMGKADTTPPEDVTNLLARVKNAERALVELRWTASKNSAGDLADQVVYQSPDRAGKSFGTGTSLGASAAALEVEDLAPGSWYTFKVTTKDTSGNESKGILKSLYLAETGPGMVAAGLTSLVMAFYARKKKKK